MPKAAFNGVDFEANVNFYRLRADRLARAKEGLKKSGLGALLCYDFDNIRYITGTYIGEWNRNKMNRHCLLIDGVEEPILFDPAAPSKRQRVDWLKPEHILPAVGSMRGAIPKEVGMIEKEAEEVVKYLREYGVENKPLGLDITDVSMIRAFESHNIEVVDGQDVMVDVRIIKTED